MSLTALFLPIDRFPASLIACSALKLTLGSNVTLAARGRVLEPMSVRARSVRDYLA